MIVVGIDPGLSGAIAAIDGKGNLVSLSDAPSLMVKKAKGHKHVYLESEMARLLYVLKDTGDVRIVALENVHAMPGQGVTSMFSMGTGFGLWLGIIAALRLPYERVEPGKWKREMGLTSGAGKNDSIVKAARLFPSADLHLKKHDGRAEALLLCEWMRRKLAV